MATVTDHAPGTVCWIELFTSDVAAARAFYGELLGWESSDPDPQFGGYVNFSRDGRLAAGLMGNDGTQGAPDAWTTYLCVEDAEATAARAQAAGGQVMVPAMEVGPMGSMAVLADPSGAAVGLWQPGTHRGVGVHAEAGALAWNELHSRDHAAAVPFYVDLFGWQADVMSDTDDFRYTTGTLDGRPVAGIMDSSRILPEGVPSHWAVYLAVDDADQAAATTQRLGGSVVRPPEDTPFGRMAELADPAGVGFRVHQVETFPSG